MLVFKFGGASVDSVERIKNIVPILSRYSDEKILVVVSAMGKITNALEKVSEAFYNGKKEECLKLFEQVKNYHLDIAKYVLDKSGLACDEQLKNFFTEVEWLLYDKPVRDYDYYYDQIVCVGELLSTTIISHYINEAGIKNDWVDVRDIFRTDDNFRDAFINWDVTSTQINERIVPKFKSTNIVLTQGFIGATDENESTTLGREGSDFSASVFANILDAGKQIIWKDVPGVMNADPKLFPDAEQIHELSYSEVIEMAYYGAQVIHPKTIKPLQNKKIPLYVKCFLDPDHAGTLITAKRAKALPPIVVVKENQVMIELSSKDFSFVEEKPVNELFKIFKGLKIKPNLTQNGAIKMICVLDDRSDKIEKLAMGASRIFDVQLVRGLTLLTVRHYTKELYDKLTSGKKTLLLQRTTDIVQAVLQ